MFPVWNTALRSRLIRFGVDALLAATAFLLAFELRLLDAPPGTTERYADMMFTSVAFVAIGQAVILDLMRQHQTWWRYFRLGNLWALAGACLIAALAMQAVFTIVQPFDDPLPRSIAPLDFILLTMLAATARIVARTVAERPDKSRRGATRRVLVIGAGEGGRQVAYELQRNAGLGGKVIGFLDDDPGKQGLRLEGAKVIGTTAEIGAVLDRLAPGEVILAIPSAPGSLRAVVATAARERQIPVRTLPTVFELLRDGSQLTRQLRELRVEDVLGRDPVVMELDRVGAYLADRVVLVTGAGGSVGSELARQISLVRPKKLILLDHSEHALFEIDRELRGERHVGNAVPVLADCKDAERIEGVMARFRPDIVFHAAAYKHVPMMESNPYEAVRNNALGTRVVAEAAAAIGAERFVLISTDKAVNPRTVMGASKAMAEWVVEAAGRRHARTRFITVRFGNVLASSGSVVPIFRAQIARGGPVTVTDPEMTRYFMTIPEAVQLVIQAADLGSEPGDVFVLEMGEPVRIVDLAMNMISLAGFEPGKDIAIEYVGARTGEKLHEELFGLGEKRRSTTAERIIRAVRETPIDPDWVARTLDAFAATDVAGDEALFARRAVETVIAQTRAAPELPEDVPTTPGEQAPSG